VVRQPEVHVYTHVVPVTLDAGVVKTSSGKGSKGK